MEITYQGKLKVRNGIIALLLSVMGFCITSVMTYLLLVGIKYVYGNVPGYTGIIVFAVACLSGGYISVSVPKNRSATEKLYSSLAFGAVISFLALYIFSIPVVGIDQQAISSAAIVLMTMAISMLGFVAGVKK